MVNVVRMPTVDYLKVAGYARAEECGFTPAVTASGRPAFWRPGWWGQELKNRGRVLFTARAEKGWQRWPVPWGDRLHPTRVDVCCDIEGFTFTEDMRRLFTYRQPRSSNEYRGEEMETLYIGSLAKHTTMLLRIYNKTHKCTDADMTLWARNGWTGGDVWRIEYEHHDRALPETVCVPECAMTLWRDGLARYRMCAVNPRTYNQQNAAPTHPLWEALGEPAKLTRRRAPSVHAPLDERLTRAFERLLVRAGEHRLKDLQRRLTNAVVACGGAPHVKGREEEEEQT